MSTLTINWPDSIDEHTFLQQYWQQKPLLIPQAFPLFDNPLDANELAGLACDPDANSRFMQRVQGDEWRMCGGPLSDDFFDDVTGHEWSLLVSDVEKLLPDFRAYLQPFRFLPDWRIDDLMISYAPVGGSVGAHVDQYDVFLLQADGIREWQIENTPRVGHQPSVSSSISLLADFEADDTMHLSAGDMLYLPPGYAHHGIAVEESCMTWSIGFRAPSAEEMLPSILRYLCNSADDSMTARFADVGRTATEQPGHIDTQDIRELRDMVREALTVDDTQLDLCIGRFLTESVDEELEALPAPAEWNEVSAQLNSGGILVCNSHIKFATIADEQTNDAIDLKQPTTSTVKQTTVKLLVNGEAHDCSEHLGACLSNNRQCRESDIQTGQDKAMIVELFNKQYLCIEDYNDH